MPNNNPFSYVPQFIPQMNEAPPIPQIPALNISPNTSQLQSNLQLPSIGSLMQPQQPGGSFDLMASFNQGNQQIQQLKSLADRPVSPPRPEPSSSFGRGYTPTKEEMRRLRMGGDPKKIFGANYEAWANTPITRADEHARTYKSPEQRARENRHRQKAEFRRTH